MEEKKVNIVLIGASIGKGWNIENFPLRSKMHHISIKYYHGGSDFDKTEKINEILNSTDPPDILIIKECAAYFPGDLLRYQKLLMKWVINCNEKKVIPILSTVIPVTRSHEIKKNLYYFIRGRSLDLFKSNPFKNSRLKSIMVYNEWLQIFTEENDIILLDLAKSLIKNGKDYLNPSIAQIDGLHISKNGYEKLDLELKKILDNINIKEGFFNGL
jgi:hypothetical protein